VVEPVETLSRHAQRADRTKKTTFLVAPCFAKSKPVRRGHNRLSLSIFMRNVERADAGMTLNLFAMPVMDWRRNSGEDEQEDKKDGNCSRLF